MKWSGSWWISIPKAVGAACSWNCLLNKTLIKIIQITSVKETPFLSILRFEVLHKSWFLSLITSVGPWLYFLAARTIWFEWSTQWWAILRPLESFYKQLGIVAPFFPFRIHREILAVKKKAYVLFNIVLSQYVSWFWLVFLICFQISVSCLLKCSWSQ